MKTCYDPVKKQWNGNTVDRLPKHDLFFGTPENRPTAGIPIGDGDTGSLLWLERDGIHIHINKCDLWQDAPPGVTWNDECYCSGHEEELTCVKHGGEITLRLNSPAFDYLYQRAFTARLSLADATASLESETPFGSVCARAFAENGVTVLSCRMTSAEGEAPEIRLSRWGSRTLWRWYAMQKHAPETSLEGTNAVAEGKDLLITQELDPTKFCLALRFLSEETPRAAVRNRHCAALTLADAKEHTFTLLWTVKTGETSEDAAEACRMALDAAEQAGEAALYEAHRAAWADFWNCSYLAIPDDYAENIWYLYLYYMNSESRGAYPPHFTSGLWGFYHDYIPWNYYFHYNEQHMYLPLDAAGHGELAENYFALRKNGMEKNRAYARLVKGKRGIFLHDVTDRFGRGAEYHYMNCSPGAQVAMHLWRHWRFTGDEAFLRETALPFLREAVIFYLDLLEKGEDGLFHLHGTSAYESNETLDDACTDFTMIRTLFPVYLPYAPSPLRERMEEALARLPEPILLPLRVPTDWNGETISFGVGKGRKARGDRVFGVGYKDGLPVRHGFGDPAVPPEIEAFPDVELSPLYPAGLLGLNDRDTPLWDALYNQLLLHRPGTETGHWNILPIYLARMGMGAEALKAVREMLSDFQAFPNGMNAEDGEVGTLRRDAPAFYTYDNEGTHEKYTVRSDDFVHFDFETEPIVAQALQECLLQSHEGVLRLLPATESLPVAFRLYAEGGFAVGADFREEGFAVTVESLRGEPCYLVLPQGCGEAYAYAAPKDGPFAPFPLKKTVFRREGSLSGNKPGEPAWDLSDLKPGDTALLCSCPLEALRTETPAPCAPNGDWKRLGKACLGSPRLMR